MNSLKVNVMDIAAEIGDFSPLFAFRPKGKQMRQVLEESYISKMPPYYGLELDFKGVKLCDPTFLDEFILGTIGNIIEKKEEKMICLTNFGIDLKDYFHMAFVYRKARGQNFSVAWRSGSAVYPLGILESSLKMAFIATWTGGKRTITAKEFSDIFVEDKISLANAAVILKRVYDYRLILREEKKDDRGRYFEYFVPF